MRQQTNTSWRRSCSNQKHHGTNGTLYERGIAKYLNQFEESHLTSTHEYTTTFAPFGLPAYRPSPFGIRLASAATVGPTNPIVQLHPPPLNFNNPPTAISQENQEKADYGQISTGQQVSRFLYRGQDISSFTARFLLPPIRTIQNQTSTSSGTSRHSASKFFSQPYCNAVTLSPLMLIFTYKRGGVMNIERGMKGSDNIWTSMFMMPKKITYLQRNGGTNGIGWCSKH